MKQKINVRLVVVAMIAVIATTLGILSVSYKLFQQRVRHDLQVNAEMLAHTRMFVTLYDQVEGGVIASTSPIYQAMQSEDLRITWVDGDGRVLFDNETDAGELPNHGDRPEIQAAIQQGWGQSMRRSDTLNMNTYYYALRLENGSIIRVATQARSILSVFLSSVPVILSIIVMILLVCVWLAHLLTESLLKPIDLMAEHLDDTLDPVQYKELIPFADKIRSQHENILAAVKSRQDFTANVSHELKTPLTAISGYAELIETGMVEGEQVEHIAQQIHHNSDRLLSLINDIIKLSEMDHKEQYQEHSTVDLYQVAANCCESLQINAVRKNIYLKLKGNSVMMKGDRELLREMISNLIQNSIQYNNEGGYVEVLVRMEGVHPILQVEDNGIGIPKDQQERVFERFYRVDKSRSRATGGTGLGLAIVKHIAEIHNAEIKVDSDLGKGTRIRISF